jgi:hypothetical protein
MPSASVSLWVDSSHPMILLLSLIPKVTLILDIGLSLLSFSIAVNTESTLTLI